MRLRHGTPRGDVWRFSAPGLTWFEAVGALICVWNRMVWLGV
ncbi:Hypothetical protein AA314_09452 [Archangium gephyra]|uniref:Uncharacterized protein n=1 Tax=Archangium gephyra TaxID=48 RepID=A0AAC8QHV7_9BACT|nr:Hypothetical protein AA314_09452 [Archangium gephyra]